MIPTHNTSITENTAIWAAFYGHREFVTVFAAEKSAADRIIDSIKAELERNDLLLADFPEICLPIRALDGRPQRCPYQTYHGRPTLMHLGAGEVVLPTIIPCTCKPGTTSCPWLPHPRGCLAKSSGAIILSYGLTAASRGAKFKRPDGRNARPDLAIVDDFQTNESRKNHPSRLRNGWASSRKVSSRAPATSVSLLVIINGTVIQPDDGMDQLLSDPAWQGARAAMVKTWPGGSRESEPHKMLWMVQYARNLAHDLRPRERDRPGTGTRGGHGVLCRAPRRNGCRLGGVVGGMLQSRQRNLRAPARL